MPDGDIATHYRNPTNKYQDEPIYTENEQPNAHTHH